MKWRGLWSGLLGVVGTLLMTLPAEAARLLTWQFNASANRLEFTTDTGVQPRAQLVLNPSRIVIDLPGVTLGRSQMSQAYSQQGVEEVRIGQFDAQTTRIVIELSPGYTVDPLQVQVRGTTPTQWTVQLPPLLQEDARALQQPLSPPTSATPPVAGAETELENVRITPDGFFIRTRGEAPEVEVSRSRDRRQLTLDFADTTLSAQLPQNEPLPVDRYGVGQITFSQPETDPPVARLTMELTEDSPDWNVSVSSLGGVALVPVGGMIGNAIAPGSSESLVQTTQAPQPNPIATIQSIRLDNNSQLVIEADQPFTYTSGWDRATTDYQITLSGARLAEQVTGPELGADSALQRVRLRQDGDDTVVILIRPAAGAFIGDLNQPTRRMLALQIQPPGHAQIPTVPNNGSSIPVTPNPNAPLPVVRDGRVLVVLDPGHGGPDPGAIGIGGIRETDIVLSIANQVANILEEQGVQAILTRTDERDLDLDPRVQFADRVDADLFVSIHANAIDLSRPDINGIETYYYSDAGLRLARVIHASMVQGTGRPDRGVRQARFYVLVHTSMPAVLLETGFVTGGEDARLLTDPAFQRRMAESIARGILQYIQQNY